MRKVRWWVVAVMFVLLSGGIAGAVDQYGRPLSLDAPTPISQILSGPEAYLGSEVLVEGTVVQVCAKRGCWIELASDREFQKLRIKVKDGVIVFPMSAQGLTARVQGVLEEIRLSEAQARARKKHFAEEQGGTFDPASVTGPEVHYQIRAMGAEIG